ncbi:uncharacterized protein ARMOST_19014 [Armillaria ostoyae]|uniref:Heterokaryon incompatibility domain-containing protein n=1 Tax=Armillaria ostoyae TaxID=47428 RepID=A0A284S3E4_ARMOS|nr:uncharacterized protein ARMOST_19014 [Armillaria ostoyae]
MLAPIHYIKSKGKRRRSVFSTSRTMKELSADTVSDSEQNANIATPSETQSEILHARSNSTATIGEIISEVIPAYSSSLRPESSSKSLVADPQSSSEDSDDTSGDSDMTSYVPRHRRWPPKDIAFPKVKISAFIETGREKSSIIVPKQRSYTSRHPVIPSSLADTPCTTLGVQGVLDRLNATLRTPYTLDTPSLRSILGDCVEKNYDFGTAYGRLRQIWYTADCSNIRDELRRHEQMDRKMRWKALEGNRIVSPDLPPRRVWDLYSNRVVPWWVWDIRCPQEWPRPISHAWVDEKDRMDVITPINRKEWPVPIPKGTSLDLIRIEMLNLGVEYTWLDVLCLRQKGGLKEDLCMEEWKLDVPTIGYVYWDAKVVIYLSGLGLPLSLEEGDLDSDQCWFRHAWTLQEVCGSGISIIAGDMSDGLMHAEPIDNDGNYKTGLLTRFHKQLGPMRGGNVLTQLMDMQDRVSTNPVDKVAGLTFPLRPRSIPAYHESESLEDAWTALVNAMYPFMRVSLFLFYPGVGLGCKKWRPTWEQVMTEPLPQDANCDVLVGHDDKTDEDLFEGSCIAKGHVHGLDVGFAEGVDRCGELVVKSGDGIPHTFTIHATHQILIPKDAYTLLGCDTVDINGIEQQHWVVGQRLPRQRFEKMSVVVMDDKKDVERLAGLGIIHTKSYNILV